MGRSTARTSALPKPETEPHPPLSSRATKRSGPRTRPSLYLVDAGCPHPLGATPDAGGVNFSVFSRHATSVELLLFDNHDDLEPTQIVALDPCGHKTYHFWHAYVRGLEPGTHYAFRVDGPRDRSGGSRFQKNKVLIDPYAKGNTSALWNRGDACGDGDNLHTSMRSVVIDVSGYDWEGDRPLNRPMTETIIYETHVGGFTKSPTSGVEHPGTFAGIIEKIPYLKSLGITAVELLPVSEFDRTEINGVNPITGRPLMNYWGYSTVSFFAPEDSYCVSPEQGSHLDEFRDMVKALHKAGIEVILDMVFNHTSEGNHQGPTINLRGFDNSLYYHLVRGDKQYYMDYSGCGNTVNCNHPVPEKLITECLEFWVRDMHVDGFRFDEGSILSRGHDGAPMPYPPVVWNIELSEALADTKIIAEAWDAAGLYQIGGFPGYRWAEWNGRFRDDIRRFVRGDGGMVGAVAARIAGSADIYQAGGHEPMNSINFVDCHDGFTLYDLVSYNSKHNEANGEGNRDGIDENLSWNCGAEGETADPNVAALRRRQVKNFAAMLFLSQGVPMMLGGDELQRTQQGNNNAYCQDNELSWYDWTLVEKNSDILRFFRQMIAFRQRNRALRRNCFFKGAVNARGLADVTWHGCLLNAPGWNDPDCRELAFTLGGVEDDADIHVMFNMAGSDKPFELPAIGRQWLRVIDTSLPSPDDIAEPGSEIPITGSSYYVNARSVVVLIAGGAVARSPRTRKQVQ